MGLTGLKDEEMNIENQQADLEPPFALHPTVKKGPERRMTWIQNINR